MGQSEKQGREASEKGQEENECYCPCKDVCGCQGEMAKSKGGGKDDALAPVSHKRVYHLGLLTFRLTAVKRRFMEGA